MNVCLAKQKQVGGHDGPAVLVQHVTPVPLSRADTLKVILCAAVTLRCCR